MLIGLRHLLVTFMDVISADNHIFFLCTLKLITRQDLCISYLREIAYYDIKGISLSRKEVLSDSSERHCALKHTSQTRFSLIFVAAHWLDFLSEIKQLLFLSCKKSLLLP